jgi:Mechanosensitive ion channel, conserved TM helix
MMSDKLRYPFLQLGEKIIDYLPYLLAGLVLLIAGLILGWIVKRVVIQLAAILRLDRFLTGFRRGEIFAKADVRYGFYNFLGNVGLVIIFLVFLNAALDAMKLSVLSSLLEKGIYFIPKVILALVIFGAGWFVAAAASRALDNALRQEKIPKSSLVARVAKAVIIVIFSSMALVELDIARQIVIIGFAAIIISVAIVSVVLVVLGGKDLLRELTESHNKDGQNEESRTSSM